MVPVFVSCASQLNDLQESRRAVLSNLLARYGLEGRTLGRTDYAYETPLKEVMKLARRCHGGLIVGFKQIHLMNGVFREGTPSASELSDVQIPTPWNHIETGMLFALGLPLLVIREEGVSGGIFDIGTGDVFVHTLPHSELEGPEWSTLEQVIRRWAAEVEWHYQRLGQ